MGYPWTAHDILTASDLNDAIEASRTLVVVKSTNQTVTSSTTLVNDNELFADLEAGHIYRLTAVILASGAAAGDIRVAWARTGTISFLGQRMCRGPASSITDVTAATMRVTGGHAGTTAIAYGTDGSSFSNIEETILLNCTADGRITLQWAQGTSSGTATTVTSGSYLMIEEVRQ